MAALIPDDWDGISFDCVQIQWPSSEQWRAILLGQANEPYQTNYWEGSEAERQDASLAVQNALDMTFSEELGCAVTDTKIAIIQDRKSSGVAGGLFEEGLWRVRDLTLIFVDEIGISVSGNQFTIPAGKYLISASCPAFAVSRHQCRLRNISSAQIYPGSSEFASAVSGSTQSRSFLNVATTISSENTFVLEHRCQFSKADNGFGVESGNTFVVEFELYSEVLIQKLNGD